MNSKRPPRISPSPPSGERVGVRGQTAPQRPSPHYGKRRNRDASARAFARALRKRLTNAEARLWRLLRNRQFAQFKFRRQYPCGPYYLDFCCVAAKLAVELDGGGHGHPQQRAKDLRRLQFLDRQGIRVLRFWNHQLFGELDSVQFEIWHALMSRTGRQAEIDAFVPPSAAPSPSPSPPRGRGACGA